MRSGPWFFDTELLILAQRERLRIHEVPVDWTGDPDSRVQLVPTALDDLRGAWWLMRSGPSRLVRFAVVGAVSTIAYLLIYLVMRDVAPAWLANLIALLTTAVANTAANRRFTFGVHGREGMTGVFAAGLAAFLLGLLLTSAAAAALHLLAPTAPHVFEVATLTTANLAATLCRYLLFNGWMDSRLQVVAADGAQVVEDSDPEGHDRRDGQIHPELVAEIGQAAGERHVRDQSTEEHARLERAGDVRLERTEYRVERRQQRDRGVARVGDRDRDRRQQSEDHAEDRERDRDDDYLHGFGVGVGAALGDGEGGGGSSDL